MDTIFVGPPTAERVHKLFTIESSDSAIPWDKAEGFASTWTSEQEELHEEEGLPAPPSDPEIRLLHVARIFRPYSSRDPVYVFDFALMVCER